MAKKIYLLGASFIFTTVLVLGLVLIISKRVNPQLTHGLTRPNLILISVDTLRPDHLSVFGYDKETAPHISSWANRSAFIFDKTYTTTPLTYPSFATLMTGLTPFESAIYNNGKVERADDGRLVTYPENGFLPIGNPQRTLASVLKNHGYSTAGFGENYALYNRGTDIGSGFDRYQIIGDQNVSQEGSVTELSLDFLKTAVSKTQPFFLWVHYLDPHEAFTPTPEDACRFGKEFCKDVKEKGVHALAEEGKRLSSCQFNPLPEKIIKTQEMLYDGEIYETDSSIGRIMSFIKENGLDKNSIIVFYSDHGEGFDHNYYFTHSDVLYESAVRIVFMLSLPNSSQSEHISQAVTNAQIYPTLLSLLGVGTEQDQQNSLITITNGSVKKSVGEQKPIFFVNQNKGKFSVIDGKYKYIYSISGGSKSCLSRYRDELYDLEADPQEVHNIATEKLDITQRLSNLLITYINESQLKISPTGGYYQSQGTPYPQRDQQILKSIQELGY